MRVIYLKEAEKAEKFLDKIKQCLDYYFNTIRIINEIYCLPLPCSKKINKRKHKKISYKVVRRLEKDKANIVVLSNTINKLDCLKNVLYSENINILNGRFLFKCLYNEIIDYILDIKEERTEDSQIWITINDYTELNKDIIVDIAKRIKTLNIVTNNINQCRRIEKYLYNEYGILLNISNSRKSALVKSGIILNFDFPEEMINKYIINRNAIIVNFQGKIQIQSKKFNGININYYNINIPNEYKLEGFENQEIYESKIYNYNLNTIQEFFDKDDIRIEYLIGDKGKINEQEYKII